ncbi:MAG: hypothetical protein OHK0037_34620 [Elainellaceae cyanobacterium]
MDEALQWSAVTLVGLGLWALALALRSNSARWSAPIQVPRLGQAINSLDTQTEASVQKTAAPLAKAPEAAVKLTYRGVSYLRWR